MTVGLITPIVTVLHLPPEKNMRVLLLLAFFVITHLIPAQNRRLDSLRATLQNHLGEDTLKVRLLNELSFRILKNKPKQSLAYAQQALKLAQQLKFQQGIGEAKNNLAVFHLLNGNADLALGEAFEAVKIAEQNNLTGLLANGYATLGTIYQN